METEDEEFNEEFVGERDPSILHFLLASGDRISSKQLRDDLMTLLIAGHETTAAVLTWTLYCLAQHPQHVQRIQQEVCFYSFESYKVSFPTCGNDAHLAAVLPWHSTRSMCSAPSRRCRIVSSEFRRGPRIQAFLPSRQRNT